jgi:hypothetical protein
LYLQTLKTLSVLFLVLSVLNLPVYIIYHSTTEDNNLSNIDDLFRYFTLGNLGRPNLICGHSDIREKMIEDYPGDKINMKLECPAGYISNIERFGLLYYDEPSTGKPSNGNETCNSVMNIINKVE